VQAERCNPGRESRNDRCRWWQRRRKSRQIPFIPRSSLVLTNLQAAVLALKARDEGLTGIIGQVLNIPATCHPAHFPAEKYEYGSFAQNKNATLVDAPKMLWFWEQYIPSTEQEKGKEAYASPLLADDLSGLPPALIQVAGYDPLREGLAYGEALEAAGVKARVEAFKGLPHGFVFFTHLKEAREYIQNVVDFVNDVQKQVGSR